MKSKVKPQEFDWFEETEPKNIQFICPNWTVSKLIDYVVNEQTLVKVQNGRMVCSSSNIIVDLDLVQ